MVRALFFCTFGFYLCLSTALAGPDTPKDVLLQQVFSDFSGKYLIVRFGNLWTKNPDFIGHNTLFWGTREKLEQLYLTDGTPGSSANFSVKYLDRGTREGEIAAVNKELTLRVDGKTKQFKLVSYAEMEEIQNLIRSEKTPLVKLSTEPRVPLFFLRVSGRNDYIYVDVARFFLGSSAQVRVQRGPWGNLTPVEMPLVTRNTNDGATAMEIASRSKDTVIAIPAKGDEAYLGVSKRQDSEDYVVLQLIKSPLPETSSQARAMGISNPNIDPDFGQRSVPSELFKPRQTLTYKVVEIEPEEPALKEVAKRLVPRQPSRQTTERPGVRYPTQGEIESLKIEAAFKDTNGNVLIRFRTDPTNAFLGDNLIFWGSFVRGLHQLHAARSHGSIAQKNLQVDYEDLRSPEGGRIVMDGRDVAIHANKTSQFMHPLGMGDTNLFLNFIKTGKIPLFSLPQLRKVEKVLSFVAKPAQGRPETRVALMTFYIDAPRYRQDDSVRVFLMGPEGELLFSETTKNIARYENGRLAFISFAPKLAQQIEEFHFPVNNGATGETEGPVWKSLRNGLVVQKRHLDEVDLYSASELVEQLRKEVPDASLSPDLLRTPSDALYSCQGRLTE